MRLVDLDPHWIGLMYWASPEPFYVGVSFWCPHCDPALPEHGSDRRQRLAFQFWPPIDPEKMMGRIFNLPDNGGWRRISGETFETLTIESSINNSGHWHGHITNGEIIG